MHCRHLASIFVVLCLAGCDKPNSPVGDGSVSTDASYGYRDATTGDVQMRVDGTADGQIGDASPLDAQTAQLDASLDSQPSTLPDSTVDAPIDGRAEDGSTSGRHFLVLGDEASDGTFRPWADRERVVWGVSRSFNTPALWVAPREAEPRNGYVDYLAKYTVHAVNGSNPYDPTGLWTTTANRSIAAWFRAIRSPRGVWLHFGTEPNEFLPEVELEFRFEIALVDRMGRRAGMRYDTHRVIAVPPDISAPRYSFEVGEEGTGRFIRWRTGDTVTARDVAGTPTVRFAVRVLRNVLSADPLAITWTPVPSVDGGLLTQSAVANYVRVPNDQVSIASNVEVPAPPPGRYRAQIVATNVRSATVVETMTFVAEVVVVGP